MESRHGGENPVGPGTPGTLPSTFGAQLWWQGPGFGATSPGVLPENANKPPSVDLPVGRGGRQSQLPGGASKVSKEPENMGTQAGSDGSHGKEHQPLQSVSSAIPTMMPEYLVPHIPSELGQSVVCAAYAFSDPYYAGLMTAYGTQALVHPQLPGMPHTRVSLPLEMTEEPVYVNAKQYHGILRRRQSRAKLELEKKHIKARKPYLHESRHQHALRRARGCGGRFLNKKNTDANAANPNPEKGANPGGTNPTKSASSCNSDAQPSDCSGNLDSASTMLVVGSPGMQGTCNSHTTSSKAYKEHPGFQMSAFERVEEGDCSGQQRGGILGNRAPNRAVAIK